MAKKKGKNNADSQNARLPKVKGASTRRHIRRLESKIRRHEKRKWDVSGLQRELSYATGKVPRPAHKTGLEAQMMRRYHTKLPDVADESSNP